MYIYQGLVLLTLLFFIVMFDGVSRYSATVLFLGLLFYLVNIISVSVDVAYYMLVLCKDLALGLLLEKGLPVIKLRNKKAAFFSYALVLITFIGLLFWFFRISPIYYDIPYCVIVILQLFFIIPEGLVSDGRDRFVNKLGMVCSRCFVCIKAYAKMCKTH